MTWQLFQDAFLDKFFPLEMREAKIEEFMNLRQGSMTVKEYCLRFNQLSKYAPSMMADSRTIMSKFVTGVLIYIVKEGRSSMLNREMDSFTLSTSICWACIINRERSISLLRIVNLYSFTT